MAEENVKVAVRVRPFNSREKNANSKLIVEMAGNQTVIREPDTNEEKKYAYDFSYWSFDGFKTEADGYLAATSPKYSDQKKVFNDLGEGILNNAWEGYNATLFAYGQTGSGKSYSVVGYGANKGIVPITCDEIFKKSEPLKASGKNIEVTFSMLEIYSEVVRDLLAPSANRKSGLPVRQDPKNGFYAQGQKKVLVDSYDDIVKLMDEGTSNRTIAATNMNATSSRAHTIVTINLIQKYKNDAGAEMAKSSLINLVDLAGSERADATGATGERLKEGAAINLSLTSLGNVISALADNSAGKNVRVPYRDSVLTKLLMNALGGNSKTIMVAAISPADINYAESVSTLRYADRAKQIKTKAIVNEDPTEKLIRDLKEENSRLKKLLEGGNIDPALLKGSGDDNDDDADEEALRKQLEENDRNMEEMQKTYEQKLAEAKALAGNSDRIAIFEKAKKTPHLTNINMDPSLSGSIKILLEGDGQKKIGLSDQCDISLKGIGILDEHGTITKTANNFVIERLNDSKILRNGILLSSPSELTHLDRLVFGTSQYYLFIDPAKASAKDPVFTFEMAQDEIGRASGIISKENNSHLNKDQLLCQAELIDLLPQIEEANAISIALDKKVVFTAIPVSASARGEYDGKVKAYVSVKNFATGLEWLWKKEKFLNRKADMTELYLDFKDDGVINREKFKSYDPFYESPDTPTQIGTAMIFPKTLPYMLPNKTDAKILDLRSNEAGTVQIEILPCNASGKPFTEKEYEEAGSNLIADPKTDLLNKPISFMIKIGAANIENPIYEDIYCSFQIYKEPTIIKTNTIRGTNKPDFKFSKNFTFIATEEILNFLLNKCFYIQIFGEQKHPSPEQYNSKISTKEYFDREKLNSQNNMIGKVSNNIDPESEKLKDELKLSKTKIMRLENTVVNLNKILEISGGLPIGANYLQRILYCSNDQEANKIFNDYSKSKEKFSEYYDNKDGVVVSINGQEFDFGNGKNGKTAVCSIL